MSTSLDYLNKEDAAVLLESPNSIVPSYATLLDSSKIRNVNHRTLGKSGLEVSVVGLGCNNFGMRIDLEATRKVVDKAIDLGITLFDTADIYGNMGGSETMLGQVLGARRKDIVLATKFAGPMWEGVTRRNASRRYIMTAVEASLRRLQTDWIDLYQLHFPDPLTPMEETLGALDDLVRQGKVRYIGCSNLPAWKIVESQWIARDGGLSRFISAQDEYSLIARHHEMEKLPAIEAYGMGLLPYFPLACGLLTGKYKRGENAPAGSRFAGIQRLAERYSTDANWTLVEHLESFCAARNHKLLELAFSWLLSKPFVSSVIAGATKPEQLEANVQAADWKLTAEDLAEIDRMPRGHVNPL
jgi:aryl-alcohol dehydrogenase-like predicted oxidoreductase